MMLLSKLLYQSIARLSMIIIVSCALTGCCCNKRYCQEEVVHNYIPSCVNCSAEKRLIANLKSLEAGKTIFTFHGEQCCAE